MSSTEQIMAASAESAVRWRKKRPGMSKKNSGTSTSTKGGASGSSSGKKVSYSEVKHFETSSRSHWNYDHLSWVTDDKQKFTGKLSSNFSVSN